MDTEDFSYLDNFTDEAVLISINPSLVEMGAKLKHNISEIVTPAADEVPQKRTFISHAIYFKASAELIENI